MRGHGGRGSEGRRALPEYAPSRTKSFSWVRDAHLSKARKVRWLRPTEPTSRARQRCIRREGTSKPQKRLDRRLEEVAKSVGSGYCRLQMPLTRALAVKQKVAGHGLGALQGGANASLGPGAAAGACRAGPLH